MRNQHLLFVKKSEEDKIGTTHFDPVKCLHNIIVRLTKNIIRINVFHKLPLRL